MRIKQSKMALGRAHGAGPGRQPLSSPVPFVGHEGSCRSRNLILESSCQVMAPRGARSPSSSAIPGVLEAGPPECIKPLGSNWGACGAWGAGVGGRAFPLGRQPSAWEVLGVHDQSPWQSSPRECEAAQRPPAGRPHSPPRLASPCPLRGPGVAAVVALWPLPRLPRRDCPHPCGEICELSQQNDYPNCCLC